MCLIILYNIVRCMSLSYIDERKLRLRIDRTANHKTILVDGERLGDRPRASSSTTHRRTATHLNRVPVQLKDAYDRSSLHELSVALVEHKCLRLTATRCDSLRQQLLQQRRLSGRAVLRARITARRARLRSTLRTQQPPVSTLTIHSLYTLCSLYTLR